MLLYYRGSEDALSTFAFIEAKVDKNALRCHLRVSSKFYVAVWIAGKIKETRYTEDSELEIVQILVS